MPYLKGLDEMVQGQQNQGIDMAWKLSRYESHRKFLGHPQTWDLFRVNQQTANHKKRAGRTADQGVVLLQENDKISQNLYWKHAW